MSQLFKTGESDFHMAISEMMGLFHTFTKVERDEDAKGRPVVFVSTFFSNMDGEVFAAQRINFKEGSWDDRKENPDVRLHFMSLDMIGQIESLRDEQKERA